MGILQLALSVVVLVLIGSLMIEAIPSVLKILMIVIIIGLVLGIARGFGVA